MRSEPPSNLDDAKRSLGREVRMLEGFVGVGIGHLLRNSSIQEKLASYCKSHWQTSKKG